MNKSSTIFLSFLFLLITSSNLYSQDIEVIFHETHLSDTLGTEIVFDFEIINISPANQVVFEVRTFNQLPEGWICSLCFGENCYSPEVDSITTFPEELAPGDTLESSLHITALDNQGTANVQIQFGTFHNPDARITQDFTAASILSNVKDHLNLNYNALLQNYPNPFNPSTDITFNLQHSSFVTLKVFNLLGEEVASLVNSNLNAGMHTVEFNAAVLTSGVYLYRLEAKGINGNSFTSMKKMILSK